jgi:hypothetical protein
MDEKLYAAFMKEFAYVIDQFQGDVADAMTLDDKSYLYEYYHSRYKLDTDESEDAMWEEFWADFNKVFDKLFKDYIS